MQRGTSAFSFHELLNKEQLNIRKEQKSDVFEHEKPDTSSFHIPKHFFRKYNHNHDPATGRFTTAPGGSKGSSGTNTPKGDSNASETKRRAHSSSFTPATTVEEARQYAKDTLGFQTVDYSMAKTPGMWESLDLETINEINATITDIQEQYPELKGMVQDLVTGRHSDYFAVVYDPSGPQNVVDRLEVRRAAQDGLEATRQKVADDVEVGFHPPESDVSSLLWHEYGHVMAHRIRCKENSGSVWGDLESHTTESGLMAEAMKKTGYTDEVKFQESISQYAKKDAAETFAEAFAEYHTSSKPRAESVALVEAALTKNNGYRQKAAETQSKMDALLREKGWEKSRKSMSFSFSELLNTEQLKKNQKPTGCGVIVVQDGKILAGRRIESNGRGRLCGPGGNIEDGETPEEAAVREAQEEFGITCNSLKPLGVLGGESAVFLCTDFTGTPTTDEKEMTDPRWMDIDAISQAESFPPFYYSLELLGDALEKANPYRDPKTGRFTFGPGGPKSGSSSTPKSLQGYSEREADWKKHVEYYMNMRQITKEQQKKATEIVTEIIENNCFSMRVSDTDELEAIINDGFFRNQFETGDSDGVYMPEYRESVENDLFGTDPFSTDGADRPKYGYVGMADAVEESWYFGDSLEHYGDIRVDFKKEALIDRTTYTIGDSLDFMGSKPLAGKCNNPSVNGMEPAWQIETVAKLSEDEYIYEGKPNPFVMVDNAGPGNLNYVELQYHGNLSVKDIECVYIPSGYQDSFTGHHPIMDVLEAAGIPYEWLY